MEIGFVLRNRFCKNSLNVKLEGDFFLKEIFKGNILFPRAHSQPASMLNT